MSSIQDLVQKIEKNQQKGEKIEKIRETNKKETSLEQPIKNTKKIREKKEAENKKEVKKNKKSIQKKKGKKNTIKRFFVTQVCTSKKSCGEHYGPYIWERLCNDYKQDPECESFEIQGFRFEKSPCQGNCKRKSNIRITEKKLHKKSSEQSSGEEEKETRENKNMTQFSYLTPIKASKLIQSIKSGASPENIKRL